MATGVIFLMGTPFCGSTILGAALGMHPQVWDAGELLYWTTRSKKAGPCACGQSPETCEFWSAAAEGLRTRGVDSAAYAELQRKSEFMRTNGFWRLLRARRTPEFKEYARITTAVFEVVRETAGKCVIVDTSKHPARGLALAGIDSLEVTFIHLVRAGKGFVTSKMKRLKRGNARTPRYIAQQTLNWSMTNFGIELVCRFARRPYVRIRYEDFLASPSEAMSQIGDCSGLQFQGVAEQLEAGVPVPFGHAVSGNALRYSGPQPLRRRSLGEEDFPAEMSWIFSLLSWPLAQRYGYKQKDPAR